MTGYDAGTPPQRGEIANLRNQLEDARVEIARLRAEVAKLRRFRMSPFSQELAQGE